MGWEPGKNLGGEMDLSGLSDEDLVQAVREHLDADQTVDASEIEIEAVDGRIELSGRVGSEVEREAAEEIVETLLGLEVITNTLRVEPTAREGARAADIPSEDIAYGEPGEVGREGSGELVTGAGVTEATPAIDEVAGTEDPDEATTEGRSYTPPDEPWSEALPSTDPPHGTAIDQPAQIQQPGRRGRRSSRVDEAVGRAARETSGAGQAARESAASFKEQMRRTAEDRERQNRSDS